MPKQTAVEWLVNELKKSKHYQQMINEVNQNSTVAIDVIEQALEMQKEQIMNDYWEGGQDVPLTLQRCQEYYNETYKGGKQ
jgi:hypothetical protein